MIEAIRRVKIAHGIGYAVAVCVAVATVTLAAVSHVYIHTHQMSKPTSRKSNLQLVRAMSSNLRRIAAGKASLSQQII